MRFLKWFLWVGLNGLLIYLLLEVFRFDVEWSLTISQISVFSIFFALNIFTLLRPVLKHFADKDSVEFKDIRLTPILFVVGASLISAYFLGRIFWPLAGLFLLEFALCIYIVRQVFRGRGQKKIESQEAPSLRNNATHRFKSFRRWLKHIFWASICVSVVFALPLGRAFSEAETSRGATAARFLTFFLLMVFGVVFGTITWGISRLFTITPEQEVADITKGYLLGLFTVVVSLSIVGNLLTLILVGCYIAVKALFRLKN